jgi:hypothetical protein
MKKTKPYKTNKPLQNNGLFVSEARVMYTSKASFRKIFLHPVFEPV